MISKISLLDMNLVFQEKPNVPEYDLLYHEAEVLAAIDHFIHAWVVMIYIIKT